MPTRMSTSLMGTGTSRRSISSLELTYSCIYVYISVYFYLELMEGQRNRAARVLANPFRQRALGRVAELGDDLPDGHALREIQVNGPAPILYRKTCGLQSGRQNVQLSVRPLPCLVGLDGQGLPNMVMGCCILQCSSPLLLLMNNVVIYIGKCVICYRTQH